MTPEGKARVSIDALLQQAGWHAFNMADANIHTAHGVDGRDSPLTIGDCLVDNLRRIDDMIADMIPGKTEDTMRGE